jgi:tetratricopeptide (TPR) repeat protein
MKPFVLSASLMLLVTPCSGELAEGRRLYDEGLYSAAVPHFQRASANTPDFYYPHLMLGLALERIDAPATEIEMALSQAARLMPTSPDVHYSLAYFHWKRKHFEKAASSMQRAYELSPDGIEGRPYSRELLILMLSTAQVPPKQIVDAVSDESTSRLLKNSGFTSGQA